MMRKIVAVAALFATTLAIAAPPKQSSNDVFLAPTGQAKAGDVIDIQNMIYTLYAGKKCPLPIVNAEHMRRLEVRTGDGLSVGCWGLLLGDSVVLIDPDGRQKEMSTVVFGRATLNKDGSATLQYPSYSKYQP
ncbi:hypothetical protein [Burkholderia vietnamiensis]|nr:hypothetical protein [Burkholderia vietnamiensis]KVF98086.1 hypothetical protein WJ21_14915 [Burkholderia vietnamiensis]MDN7925701.1 hypothetical protein [Burkholderia vietnamiensis]MDN8041625.1 hypothetical protein [Burkholderia vietnamiensis]HDR9080667.1 hypothetical protein [Burkholderia vietnamiensis]HDR9135100.1 hypothetical protein [Burkholderia vietnamiensis]